MNVKDPVSPSLSIALGVALGAALGAAMMYVFDPDRGPRRRERMRDRALRTSRRSQERPANQVLAGMGLSAIVAMGITTLIRSRQTSRELLGDGEENPAFYRHLRT